MKIIINELSFDSINTFAAYLIKTHSSRILSEKECQRLEANLQMHDSLLTEIADLFALPPYPDFEQFLFALEKNSRDLRATIRDFDKDPHAIRKDRYYNKIRLEKTAEQILSEQLDTTELKRVLRGVVKDTQHLIDKEQYELAQQIIFINAIAKDYPVAIANKRYQDLTQLPRKILRELSDHLIGQLRNPILHAQDKLKAQLKLLAMLREHYFRATGVFINTTQLLSIMMAMKSGNMVIANHSPNDNIATTALIAVMHWAMSGGERIDLCMPANPLLCHETVKDFFSALGLNSSAIHYTNLRDLALYQAKNDVPFRHLIITEEDFSRFNTKQVFNLAINAEGIVAEEHSDAQQTDYVSIQELINRYLEHGQIIVLSDRLNDKKALGAQSRKCAVDHCYQLPPHDSKQDNSNKNNRMTKHQAIAKHYGRLVYDKQQVVLNQFAEWQALLHLIYPPAAWRQLDNELKKQQELLKSALEKQWVDCLKNTAHHKLQTQFLDHAVKNYELQIATLWQSTQTDLETKVEKQLVTDSLNALRYKYLKAVPMAELLQLNKLATRLTRKENSKAMNKSNFYMDASFDVDGAMLRYGEGDLSLYKRNYAERQRLLLAQDMMTAVNRSSFNKKEVLRSRISMSNNFLGLELVLLDVKHWLGSSNDSEKYHWQSIIHKLSKIYKHARMPESRELLALKTFYFTNVLTELTYSLESHLSWAALKSTSYWLERSAVKIAAADILRSVAQLKEANDLVKRQTALRDLYKQLVIHQARLEDLWIFTFGHKNTRDLINETLATLDSVVSLGSAKNKISAEFIKECKENAYAEVMKSQAQHIINKVSQKNPWLSKYAQWNTILKQLDLIAQENNSVHFLSEMHYFLSNKCNELNHTDLKLYQKVMELRRELSVVGRKYFVQHPALFDNSRYFDYKAQQLMARFKGLENVAVTGVKIKPVNTGFNHSFDMIVEGVGNHRIFNNFVRYHGPLAELNKDREALLLSIQATQLKIKSLAKAQEVLPLINLSASLKQAEIVAEFPKSLHGKIAELFAIIQKNKDITPPADLHVYPEAVQNNFLDRAFLQTLNFQDLNEDKIKEIKDRVLQNEVRTLFNKLTQPSSQPSLIYRVVNAFLPSFQESVDDLRYQFSALTTQPNSELNQFFMQELNKKIEVIGKDLVHLTNTADNELSHLKQKLQFIEEKIRSEQHNSGIFVKRFASFEQLHEFDEALRILTKDYVPVVQKEIPKHFAPDVDKVLQEEVDYLPSICVF